MRPSDRIARLCISSVLIALPLLWGAADLPAAPAAPAQVQVSPTDAKAQAAKTPAAADAVKIAAATLQKEYEASIAKNSTPLRTKSNFFTENPNPAVNPKAIIAALNRSYGSTASSIYVHWQLLSGMGGAVDDSLAPSLLDIYRDAPMPPMRPGLAPNQKAEFTQAVAHLAENDAEKINSELQSHVNDWETASKPFAEYRDELAKRLPVNFDLVRAEFRDSVQRVSAGIDGEAMMNIALTNGRKWAAADAKPDQLQDMINDVTSLLQAMGVTTAQADSNSTVETVQLKKLTKPNGPANAKGKQDPAIPPKYFTEVAWSEKAHSLQWKSATAKFVSKDDLIAFRKLLELQAQQPDDIKAKGSKNTT